MGFTRTPATEYGTDRPTMMKQITVPARIEW